MTKTNFKHLYKMASDYIRNNAESLINFVGVIAVSAVCRKFNIPVNAGFKTASEYFTRSYEPVFTAVFIPRNSTEAAIFSVLKSTEKMCMDSSRINAAKTIHDIISKNPISDETRAFAIMVLGDISEKMDLDSSRKIITAIISSIT